MSRVGKLPVEIPSGVTVNVSGLSVTVKGSKGELSARFAPEVSIELKDNQVLVAPKNKSNKFSRAMWGTVRSRVQNMVKGVSEGYTRSLEINGVGYRASADKNYVTLALGYSHEIKYAIPQGVEVKCEKPTLMHVSGADKQLVGQVCSEIRSLRKPEPYKGKGVRYVGEYVRQKEGKKK